MSRKSSKWRRYGAVGAGRTVGVLLLTSAGSHVVTQGRVTSLPQRKPLLLGVVVVVVSAFMTVARPVLLLTLGLLLPLPQLRLCLLLFPFVLFDAVEQTAGDEGHRHEEDNGRAYNGCQDGHTEAVVLVGRQRFTVGLPHPVGAVGIHDAHQLTPHQFVFGWALQGDDCAHVGAIALDDPLGAQGWQGHGRTLGMT